MSLTLSGSTGITTSGASSSGGGDVATNTALGGAALAANTTGANNTAVGYQALDATTTGFQNVVMGVDAGGDSNSSYLTAIGYQAGKANTDTANGNTMVGWRAGTANTSGVITAIGTGALAANTTGTNNTAVGYGALDSNTTGINNTAVGSAALGACTTGVGNTVVGFGAGGSITTGSYNTFIGRQASGAAGDEITTGSKNTIIGGYNGNQGGLDIRTASNYIVLSDGDGTPKIYWPDQSPRSAGTWITTSNTPVTAASVGSNPGTAAVWDGSGNLYKQSSSIRYKENIAEWTVTDTQLDAFVNLNPKLWDYIGKENGCAGFIAEDIESLGLKNAYDTSPLLNYSNEGEPESNRDFALIALQHKVIQRLDSAVKELKAINDAQATRIETLEAQNAAFETRLAALENK